MKSATKYIITVAASATIDATILVKTYAPTTADPDQSPRKAPNNWVARE